MLQPPKSGGAFEYVPKIRERDDEHKIVARVLAGDRDGVVELPFTAGTLLIFGGRQTLHRVTRVSGDDPRLVPVLCYSEQPDLKNSEAVRQLFWGRTGSGRTDTNTSNGDQGMNKSLVSDTDIQAFEQDGVICLRGVFELSWLEKLAQGLERNFASPGPDSTNYTEAGKPGGFYDDYCNWQTHCRIQRFCT